MRVFKGICTDYVSDIDHLFHAPDKKSVAASKAKEQEEAKYKRIGQLRDRPTVDNPAEREQDLWEDF